MPVKRGRGIPPKKVSFIKKKDEKYIPNTNYQNYLDLGGVRPIVKKGGTVGFAPKGLPMNRDIYQAYAEWVPLRDERLRLIIQNDSYLQAIYRILPNEIFKGKINFEPAYGSKCNECNYTTDKEIDECEECNSTDIKHPDQDVKKTWQKRLENVNDYGQSLESMLKIFDRFRHMLDNAAIVALKTYYFNEDPTYKDGIELGFDYVKSYVPPYMCPICEKKYLKNDKCEKCNKDLVENNQLFIAVNPDNVTFNINDEGYIAEEYFCVEHRTDVVKKDDKEYTGYCHYKDPQTNEVCGKQLLRAYYKVNVTEDKDWYYTNKELLHISYYNPTNTKGKSPAYSILALLEAKFGMDIDVKLRYADRQYPDEILIIRGANEEAFAKQEAKLHHKIQIGELPIMYIEERIGTTGGGSVPVELIKMRDDSINDLINVDARKEIRNECNRIYGVVPLFTADVQRGSALSGEGQQIRVMAKTIESNQEQYHEAVFPWIMECLMIDDWILELNPPEEETEAHEEELKNLKLGNMERAWRMGFGVAIEDSETMDYTISGEAKEQQEFGGFGGEGGFDEKPIEEPFKEDSFKSLGPDWDLTEDDIDKSFEERNYADMSIELTNEVNTFIRGGLEANAAFADVRKNIEDSDEWKKWVQSENPALDQTKALEKERYRLERIIKNEGTKIRKEHYVTNMKKRDPSNLFKYRWAGPPASDPRTSEQCKRILGMIKSKGGSVTLPELQDIMRKAVNDLVRERKIPKTATKMMDINSHQPHVGCRHRALRIS